MTPVTRQRKSGRQSIAGVVGIVIGALVLTLSPVTYGAEENSAEVGKKLADPLSDIWALFTEIDYTFSEGDLTNGQWRKGQSVIFQPIMPLKWSENFQLITRPTLPVIFTDIPHGRHYNRFDLPDGLGVILKPDGSATFKSVDGLGDASLPLLLTPKKKPGQVWGFGAGPTLVFPTGKDELSSDTWEVGPAAVVTYAKGGLQGAILGQYWWNYAEEHNNTHDTSHGSLLYSLFYNLPNAWQIGMNPTITYNDKLPSDRAWNVPIGFTVAKTVKIGKMHVKFQFGAEKSVVRDKEYGKDWNIKLNIIPVIPSMMKTPFF